MLFSVFVLDWILKLLSVGCCHSRLATNCRKIDNQGMNVASCKCQSFFPPLSDASPLTMTWAWSAGWPAHLFAPSRFTCPLQKVRGLLPTCPFTFQKSLLQHTFVLPICFLLLFFQLKHKEHWDLTLQSRCKHHVILPLGTFRLTAFDHCVYCHISLPIQTLLSLASFSPSLTLCTFAVALRHFARFSDWYPSCCHCLKQHTPTRKGWCKQ